MNLRKVMLALALAFGMSLGQIVMTGAQEPGGALNFTKACGPGVSGMATFVLTLTIPGIPNPIVIPAFPVPCGATESVPAGTAPVGTTGTLHETIPPTGAVAAADLHFTVTTANQSFTIVNNAAAAGAAGVLSIHKSCATGVSGSATFAVTVAQQTVNATVACGGTVPVAIPAAVALVGAAVMVHETTPATNGAVAADVTATLSASAQTLTIDNALATTGVVSLRKTCASGVTGTATFVVTVTPAEAAAAEISMTVSCGQTSALAVPAASNVIGAAVKIHESTPPTNGVAGADVSATLTASAQTVTINNAAAVAVVPVLPQTGRPGMPEPVLPLLLGAMMIATGFVLPRRWTD
jgi:hypothetical protein